MDIKIDDLKQFLKKYWYSAYTLLFLELSIITGFTAFIFPEMQTGEFTFFQYGILVVATIAIYFMWYGSTRIPKAAKEKIGFAIAIATYTEEQYNELKQDFVDTLKKLLLEGELKYKFSFVEIPQYYCKKIEDRESARNILKKSHCRFMVYGCAKYVISDNLEKHLLEINGIVTHRVVPKEVNRAFANEFSELFPSSVNVEKKDYLSLSFTSGWINIVARYIIGGASAMSGDLDYSQTLFEDLRTRLNQINTNLPAITKIKQRTPLHLTMIYLYKIKAIYEKSRKFNDINALEQMGVFLDKLQLIAPENYRAHLLRAIWYFLYKKDIKLAKSEIGKCRKVRHAAWRYSEAFLFAYEGNLKIAHRKYKKAFEFNFPEEELRNVEEFISKTIKQEPDKQHLCYCLGLINYIKKKDYEKANIYFQKFLNNPLNEAYVAEKEYARSCVIEMHKSSLLTARK